MHLIAACRPSQVDLAPANNSPGTNIDEASEDETDATGNTVSVRQADDAGAEAEVRTMLAGHS